MRAKEGMRHDLTAKKEALCKNGVQIISGVKLPRGVTLKYTQTHIQKEMGKCSACNMSAERFS